MSQNLTETSTFESTVPSIETTDDVVGSTVGSPNNGIVNAPHVKLMNRTKWLYDNTVKRTVDTVAGLIRFKKHCMEYLDNDASDSVTERRTIIANQVLAGAGGQQTFAAATQLTVFSFPVWASSSYSRLIRFKAMVGKQNTGSGGATKPPFVGSVDILVKYPINDDQKIFIMPSLIKPTTQTIVPFGSPKTPGEIAFMRYDGYDAATVPDNSYDASGDQNFMFILKKDRVILRNSSTDTAISFFFAQVELDGVSHINT